MKRKIRAVKLFLVDDHPAVREGLRSYLNRRHSIHVVGEAASGAEALRKLKKVRADVVVLDVELPGMDGGELASRLSRAAPSAKLVAFSLHAGQEQVVRMARSGVHGYVTKEAPPDKLMSAILRVHEGGLFFPEAMADAILAPEVRAHDDAELTEREREVLSLLADGLANKQIGARLGINIRTVESHRDNLTRKLGISTVANLTKYAIRQGLTRLAIEGAALAA
jgi:two-component system nitrate/nitrite response regulator NarL